MQFSVIHKTPHFGGALPLSIQLAYSKPHRQAFRSNYNGLYSIIWCIVQVSRVFPNGPKDQGSIPGRVIPKTQNNCT